MNRSFTYLWGIGIILCPLILRISKVMSTRESRIIFLYLLTAGLCFLSFPAREIKRKELIVLSILLLQSYSVTNNFVSINFWIQFQFFAIGLVLYALFIKNYENKNFKFLLNCIAITGISQAVFIIFEWIGFDIFELFYENVVNPGATITGGDPLGPSGTLSNRMTSAGLMAVCLPAMFRKKWCYSIPLVLLAIYATKTSMAMATYIGSILYYYYNKKTDKKLLPVIGFLLIGSYFVFFGNPINGFISDSHRFDVWGKTLSLMNSDNILFGNGLGHYTDNFFRHFIVNGERFDKVHNEFLEVIYALGLFGFSLISYAIYKIIRKCNNNILLCGVFAVLINSYGNFPFHIAPTALLAITYFAMANIEVNNV